MHAQPNSQFENRKSEIERERRPRLVIGLTGGIGSGKTTVARLFEARGVQSIDADVLARELVEPGQPAFEEIVAAFGRGVVHEGGHLDRGQVRSLVFRDPQKREQLEGILHPRIRWEMNRRLSVVTTPYCLLIIPLLIEGGRTDFVDRVAVVDTTPELQVRRTQERDGTPRQTVEEILRVQASRQERLAAADDVIDNSLDLAHLRAQVDALHQRYLDLAEGNMPPSDNR